jgi:RecJ-like exonuclease
MSPNVLTWRNEVETKQEKICGNDACKKASRNVYDHEGKKLCYNCLMDILIAERKTQTDYQVVRHDENEQSEEENFFQAEYRCNRIAGYTHIEAKNKAIDALRKHTKYISCNECDGSGKVSHVVINNNGAKCPNCHGSGKVVERLENYNSGGEDGELTDEDFFGPDSRISPEEEISFNLLIRKKLKEIKNKKHKEYLVVLCRAHGLDSFFDETTFELCNEITESYPVDEEGLASSKKLHIAKAIGLKKKSNSEYHRSDTNLWRLTDALKESFKELLTK